MTDRKKPETIEDADLDQARGGAAYLKLGDIDGESKVSFDMAIKPELTTGELGIRATNVRKSAERFIKR